MFSEYDKEALAVHISIKFILIDLVTVKMYNIYINSIITLVVTKHALYLAIRG